MEEQTIINILEQRCYDTRSAKLVAGELLQLSNPLNKLFTEWIELESCKKDFSTNGYSLLALMKERNMTYPAALLTMDWLIKDPANALTSLKRGIK